MKPAKRLIGRSPRACSIVAIGAIALVVSTLLSGEARADCQNIAQELRETLAAGNPAAAGELYGKVFQEPTCDDAFRERAGRTVSLLHALIAQERMEAGESLAAQRDLLERGLGFGRTWPLLALRGDLAHDEQDHAAAAALYQEALTVIDDVVKTPKPPPLSEIERIFRRAAQSRLLAAHYQPAPKNRSGEPSGLAAPRIRGFVVERVPVPITFHTATATFTEQGQRAVADMAGYLTAQAPGRITIEGHTDPRGSDDYNLDLSRKRAEAVARYLRDQGFAGTIRVVPKGETQRFPLDSPEAYTQEQRWQMDRRVELVR